MQIDPIKNYEKAVYPLYEDYQKNSAKNKALKSGAAFIAASFVAASVSACEPPRITVRDNSADDVASTDVTSSSDQSRSTTRASRSQKTSETTVVRRFPDQTTETDPTLFSDATDSTDYLDPYDDDYLLLGIIMYPGHDYGDVNPVGEIMIEDIDLE